MPPDCRRPGALLAAARALVRSIGKQLTPLNHLALVAEGMEAPDTSSASIKSFFKPVMAECAEHVAGGGAVSDAEAQTLEEDGDENDWNFTKGDECNNSETSFCAPTAAVASGTAAGGAAAGGAAAGTPAGRASSVTERTSAAASVIAQLLKST